MPQKTPPPTIALLGELSKLILSGILILALGFFVGQFLQAHRGNQVLGISTKLDQTRILELINFERAKRGLAAVTLNSSLSRAAHNKGEHMFTQDYWAHISPDGLQPWSFIQAENYAYQSAGENLARDFKTETELLAAWMASPTHRANILSGHYSEAGLAILDGIIAGKNVLLVVSFFAQPRSSFGLVAQTAIYDQNTESLVLGGEVIASGELLSGQTAIPWAELIFGGLILLGITIVFLKLRQKPYGPSRQRSRKSP